MADKKPRRRIKKAAISLLSLVPAGANQVRALFKSQGRVEMAALAKIDVEGYLTALVYVPDDVDFHGDFADAQVVKQMCHDFLLHKEGSGIDVLHDGMPVDPERAHICESFIVQKGDPRFVGITNQDGEPIDPTGSWGAIIKIDDPDLRSRYVSGEWVGLSMFGPAIVEPLNKSTTSKEHKMDKDQMAELLKGFGADLTKNIVDGLAKALQPKPDAPKPTEAPSVPFEGDPMDPAAIEAHAERVLFASLDMNKPADIAKWSTHLSKKREAQLQKDAANPNAERIQELESELVKLRKASTAPAADGSPAPQELTQAQKLAKGVERAAQLKKSGIIR